MATTVTKGTAAKDVPALAVFELDEEELALIGGPRGGRSATPSVYLKEVENAIQHPNKPFGIAVTGTVKGAYILGQLRKAEKQLKDSQAMPEGATLKKWNHEDSVKRPFVGFQYVPPEPAAVAS